MQLIDAFEVVGTPLGTGVRATRDIPAQTRILRFTGTWVAAPDRHSLQVARDRHLRADGQEWAYLNHSCAPNCRIEFSDWTLVADRQIRAGEDLTFDYLTTEWDMAEPFQCRCGAAGCRGRVGGLKHLPPAEQASLRRRCSPYLAGLLSSDASAGPPPDEPCPPGAFACT